MFLEKIKNDILTAFKLFQHTGDTIFHPYYKSLIQDFRKVLIELRQVKYSSKLRCSYSNYYYYSKTSWEIIIV